MKTISFKLSQPLAAKLTRVAKQRKQTQSAIVRTALEQFLNGRPAAPLTLADLAGDLQGCVEGPTDLATNPKYLDGYGQ